MFVRGLANDLGPTEPSSCHGSLIVSSWPRGIAPLSKAGPEIVSDPRNLRPMGYFDDLSGVFDALWLSVVQEKL